MKRLLDWLSRTLFRGRQPHPNATPYALLAGYSVGVGERVGGATDGAAFVAFEVLTAGGDSIAIGLTVDQARDLYKAFRQAVAVTRKLDQ